MGYLFPKQYCAVNVWKAGAALAFLLMFSFAACAQGPVIFEEDFENDLGGFVIDNSGGGLWHLSASCQVPEPGHTQGAALYYGQDSGCDYNNDNETNQGVVKSPQIDLTSYASGEILLSFKYFLETETYSSERDIASVEISKNSGPYVIIAHKYSRPNSVPLINGTAAWTECIVVLSDYAGSTVRLRFGFETVDQYHNEPYDGFFVDDIIIYGPPCNYTIAGDANKDCVVNLVDLAAMAENWLLNCYLTPGDPGCVPK